MRTSLDCFPCFVRNALVAVRHATDDREIQERLMRDVCEMLASANLETSPPALAQRVHRRIRSLTGKVDPYCREKRQFNNLILSMLPELQEQIDVSDDPFALAVRLAIAGNVIDLGVNGDISDEEIRLGIGRTLDETFQGDIDAFREDVENAGSILYLADNSGEIVFDRMLIEWLPTERVIVAVRGYPVLNDATLEDAVAIGLDRLVPVMGNGSDAPGTVLEDCSAAFRQCFHDADLIIAKGQGNYETLSDVDANIRFLFKAKCPVVARNAGVPQGTQVLALPRKACGVG